MLKKLVIISTILGFFVTINADYLFPSSNPPAGKSPDDIKQFVVFTWDDNGYSGKRGTQYEDQPGGNYQNSSWVDGVVIESGWNGTKPNDLNIREGDMGVSWAARTLAGIRVLAIQPWDDTVSYGPGDSVIYHDTVWNAAKWTDKGAIPQIYPDSTPDWARYWNFDRPILTGFTRTNPDGSPIHFTFNVITGLFVPVWPMDWQARESKYGFWKPDPELDYPDGTPIANKHTKIAVAWGRENQILVSDGGLEFQQNYIRQAFQEAKDAGHEIGNHTIDHMESNSPLPNNEKGFGRWGGEGFDSTLNDVMPWGEVINEAEYFGQKPGASAQTMGWKMYAGRYVGKNAWKGAIALAEEELDINLGISVAKGNCHSFRAPRLEVGSGLFHALKELGYQYDCGLEEGYEPNINGSNQLWPYTTDNGSPNATYQRSIDELTTITSMPFGLWELPSNVIVVPEEIHRAVYDNHYEIASAAPDGGDISTFEEWVESGAKITAYDFNIWILWGITKANWLKTMQYNLDLRINGNKAPLHYGVHTDYYTPIYDNAVLMSDFNKSSYGLNISKGWNDWRDRISAMEEFVDWALAKDCYFISGHELIEKVKEMQKDEQFGQKGHIAGATWHFFKNNDLGSTTSQESFTNDITDAAISVAAASGAEYPYPGYGVYETAGFFKGLSHVELTYKTSAPLILRLSMANDQPWEVVLGNVGPETRSGRIPVSAFHYNIYDTSGTNTSINTADINGIELQLVSSGKVKEDHTLTAKNLQLYGADGATVDINTNPVSAIRQIVSVHSLSRSLLRLNLAHEGTYTVTVLSANGKAVQLLKNNRLYAGINNLKLNNLSGGVYIITIQNSSFRTSMKALVM